MCNRCRQNEKPFLFSVFLNDNSFPILNGQPLQCVNSQIKLIVLIQISVILYANYTRNEKCLKVIFFSQNVLQWGSTSGTKRAEQGRGQFWHTMIKTIAPYTYYIDKGSLVNMGVTISFVLWVSLELDHRPTQNVSQMYHLH